MVAVSVVLCVAAFMFGAAGNWWLAAACWIAGVIVAASYLRRQDSSLDRSVGAHPSQLRRRQLDDITERDRVR
jgi:membrane protein implicated in regulation of membrane protease activity